MGISIHVPREGDDFPDAVLYSHDSISIHVPREGDDLRLAMVTQMYYISIHVPREGDDCGRFRSDLESCNFNPRPP